MMCGIIGGLSVPLPNGGANRSPLLADTLRGPFVHGNAAANAQ